MCDVINSSKAAWGAAALCVNFGSRFILSDMTPTQEKVLSSAAFKRVVLFCIVFMSTRDVMLSAALTAFAWIVLEHLLHDHSKFCLTSSSPHVCKLKAKAEGDDGQPAAHPLLQTKPLITRQMYHAAMETVRTFHAQQKTD